MEQRMHDLVDKLSDVTSELAVVKSKLEASEHSRNAITDRQAEINDKLEELINKVHRWEGKFGGVIFILGCLTAFFSGLLTFAKNWITTFGVPGK